MSEERNRYQNVEQMVQEIFEHLQDGGKVTIAFDSKWWAKRECSPYEGRIVKDAILYNKEFKTREVLDALEKMGCLYESTKGLSLCFGTIRLVA